MTTNRAKSTKRITVRTVEVDVLATAHDLATALHRAGAMDAVGMQDMDQLCLPPRPDYSGPEVKRIRAATRMSQPVFARLLGVEKSAVAQWERGAKRPSGPALRLLEVLDPNKPESPIVQVRRSLVHTT
jgi:putative transcriptional regulator